MSATTRKLTVEQLLNTAQAEKQKSARADEAMVKAGKSVQDLLKAGRAMADLSKKNPEA